jgi:hypothetical protein
MDTTCADHGPEHWPTGNLATVLIAGTVRRSRTF